VTWTERGACSKMWKEGRSQDLTGRNKARSKRRWSDLKGSHVVRYERGECHETWQHMKQDLKAGNKTWEKGIRHDFKWQHEEKSQRRACHGIQQDMWWYLKQGHEARLGGHPSILITRREHATEVM
jgi:hypothetical protein